MYRTLRRPSRVWSEEAGPPSGDPRDLRRLADPADPQWQEHTCVRVEPAAPPDQGRGHRHESALTGSELEWAIPRPVDASCRRGRPPAVVMADELKTSVDRGEAPGRQRLEVERLVFQRPEIADV